MSVADWVAVAAYAVAFLALVTFVVAYLVSSRGRALRSREGRHMLAFRSSLAVWMLNGVLINISGPYPGWRWVRDAIIIAFATAALNGVWLMLRAQRHRFRR